MVVLVIFAHKAYSGFERFGAQSSQGYKLDFSKKPQEQKSKKIKEITQKKAL